MKIEAFAVQAKKDEPNNPGNKIAFSLDGHLCFVTDPFAAHAIVKSAYDEYFMKVEMSRGRELHPNDRRYFILQLVSRILANRIDLLQIAKRV